jgi:ring-1,2-phenylacetyl-CoA epoxidase subunit PaaC
VLLVELKNGDFGQTMMRQFLFDAWSSIVLGRLINSSDKRISAIAEKVSKEVAYHVERSASTVVGLGDGTDESHARMQAALDYLYPYVGEMFLSDDTDAAMVQAGIASDPSSLRNEFDVLVAKVMANATLTVPDGAFTHKGGRTGYMHTENLGHMLTSMQWLQRAYPGAEW